MKYALFSALFIAAPEAADAQVEEEAKPGLVVLALSAGTGVSDELAEVLGEVLLVNLRQSGAFGQITSSADLQSLLDLEQQNIFFFLDCLLVPYVFLLYS